MTTTIITCDRCAATTTEGRTVLTLDAGTAPGAWPNSPTSGRPSIDLCGPCFHQILASLAQADGARADLESSTQERHP